MRVVGRARGDSGSVSVWAVMFGIVAIMLVGIAVDFGGRVVAQQEAADVARQSARAGGQPLDRASAMQGRGGSTSPEQAAAALSLIHISEPTRPCGTSRMPSSA